MGAVSGGLLSTIMGRSVASMKKSIGQLKTPIKEYSYKALNNAGKGFPDKSYDEILKMYKTEAKTRGTKAGSRGLGDPFGDWFHKADAGEGFKADILNTFKTRTDADVKRGANTFYGMGINLGKIDKDKKKAYQFYTANRPDVEKEFDTAYQSAKANNRGGFWDDFGSSGGGSRRKTYNTSPPPEPKSAYPGLGLKVRGGALYDEAGNKITTKKEVKKRYRQQAMKFHPDKKGGSNKAFTKVNIENEEIQKSNLWNKLAKLINAKK